MYPIYTTYQHQSDAFEPKELKSYRLRVLMRDGMLMYVVLSPAAQVLAAKEYRTKEPIAFVEFFETIYQNDYFLKEEYKSIEVVNGTLSFSLIPTRYFAPQRMKEFAGALIKDSFDAEHLAYHAMDEEKATAIFLVPAEVKKKCDFYFQDPEYIPACLPLINLAHFLGADHPDLLLVTLFQNQFVVTGLRDGKLCLCNAYDFQAASDMVYFIQLVQDLTKLNESQPLICLHGDFDPSGEFFEELTTYLPGIQLQKDALRPRFATQTPDIPTSQFAYLTF